MRPTRLDRELLALAFPALGALAAEPLYLLVDTAVVGRLGTAQLAALALAATILSTSVSLCIFLTYGTTARVARLHGAGEDRGAAALGPQAFWLALGIGVALGAALAAAAGPLATALGGDGEAPRLAARYLRLAALGVPCALLALAGQGFLRGIGDLRTPLVIVVAGNVANVILELLLVYGLHLGLDGSAVGTVFAQLGMGAAFAVLLLRSPTGVARRPDPAVIRSLMGVGAQIFLRSASLLACFLLATTAAARAGQTSLAAHQIAYGLFIFGALVLDALAIAAQVLVGRALGAGDADAARAAGRRAIGWSLGVGAAIGLLLLAGEDLVPRLFTSDAAVIDRAREMWPLFAALWVPAAAVFALDGILLGAGDSAYLAAAMVVAAVAFVPVVLAAGTLSGIWAALLLLMAVRLLTLGVRFAGRRWALVGATT